MFDVVAIGRAGVDLYSMDYGVPLKQVRRFAKYVGGTAANTMVGGSRLGLKCALVTRVGDDDLGEYVIDFLKREKVETKYIKRDSRRKTGLVFAEVFPGKDSKFIFYRENVADLQVSRSDLKNDLLFDTRSLLVTGTGLSKNPSCGTNFTAARQARKFGKKVVFNLDWRPSLWNASTGARLSRYRRMLEISDVIIGNKAEYLAATGKPTLDQSISSIPQGDSKLLVVTRGENGSTVILRGLKENVAGFKVTLLKGLGGGDGFIAGFLFGYLRGWDPVKAARFGNAVGAIVVTGHSCSEAMPRLPAVMKFIRESGAAL